MFASLSSFTGIIVEDVLRENMIFSPGLLRVVRVFRLGRLLRFFEGAKGVRRLLFALVKSLPGLVNIATLLCLVIFIYAIIGMSSFGYVKKSNGITDVVNFETFGNSMLLLFRIGTAAGWNTILDPLMVRPPDCDPHLPDSGPNGNCGNRFLAVFFFVSYILIIFLIIINMYIAVILENFNEAQQQEEIGVTDDDLETFIQVWEDFDPFATHYISVLQLCDFLDALDPPLRIPKPNRNVFGELNVPLKTDNRIYCLDLMQTLVRRTIGKLDGAEEEEMAMLVNRLEERFQNVRKSDTTIGSLLDQHKADNMAAARIQKAFRMWVLRCRLQQCIRAKFHKYEQLNSKQEKRQGWKEKQLEDNTHAQGHAALESVIGMLWYNQSKRSNDPGVGVEQEEIADNLTQETAEPPAVKVVNSDKTQASPNSLSVSNC